MKGFTVVYRVGENPHTVLWLANEKFERLLWVLTKITLGFSLAEL